MITDVTLPFPDLWCWDAYRYIDDSIMLPKFYSFPCCPFASKHRLPDIPGIYFVATFRKEIIYIGQARSSLKNRLHKHDRLSDFLYYQAVWVHYLTNINYESWSNPPTEQDLLILEETYGNIKDNLTILERFYIHMYSPPLNKLCRSWLNVNQQQVINKLNKIAWFYNKRKNNLAPA